MASFPWISVPMIFLFACSGDEPAAVIPSNADIARAEAALAGHREFEMGNEGRALGGSVVVHRRLLSAKSRGVIRDSGMFALGGKRTLEA